MKRFGSKFILLDWKQELVVPLDLLAWHDLQTIDFSHMTLALTVSLKAQSQFSLIVLMWQECRKSNAMPLRKEEGSLFALAFLNGGFAIYILYTLKKSQRGWFATKHFFFFLKRRRNCWDGHRGDWERGWEQYFFAAELQSGICINQAETSAGRADGGAEKKASGFCFGLCLAVRSVRRIPGSAMN